MNIIEKAILFHKENDIPLAQNIFRPHTENYYKLFREAKSLKESVFLDEFDEYLMSTDIGELAMYEGVEVPLDHPLIEAEYKGRDVELNEPKRGGDKKFYVYVKNKKGNVIKVQFGDTSGLSAKLSNVAARKSFSARHDCPNKKDKTTQIGRASCRERV